MINFRKILFFSFSLLAIGCSESGEADTGALPKESIDPNQILSEVIGLLNNQKSTIGDTLLLSFKSSAEISSVVVIFNQDTIASTGEDILLQTSGSSAGRQNISVNVRTDEKTERHSFSVEFLSDIVPQEYTYTRVAWFTHDPGAYTQGLFFHDNFLYESTGKEGSSTLRKVELKSGKVLAKVFLDDNLFGEGVTLWKDQIIQLTWHAHIGYVYTLDGFEQIKTFNYPTEGWGITTIDDVLVMSDGTETLHFLDAEALTETKTVSVYDDKGAIGNLNELEYIEGLIYANVWLTDEIITIDPVTGKVVSRIDLSDLMDANWTRPVEVLNGIAYDPDSKRMFVTGKWWPRLYEIQLVEKNPS